MEAQDLLVLKDSTRITGVIIEMGSTAVHYKDSVGSMYLKNTPNEQVAFVVLKDGTKIVVSVPGNTNHPNVLPGKFYSRQDSIRYFAHKKFLALNIASFLNNEVGLAWYEEDLKRRRRILIPLTVGYRNPAITQRIEYSRNISVNIDRKIVETGIACHYFPNYRTNLNFFMGPDFRVSAFDVVQVLFGSPFMSKSAVMVRMNLMLSTGATLRTKGPWQLTMFASGGIKADQVVNKIVDRSGKRVDPIARPFAPSLMLGLLLGYGF